MEKRRRIFWGIIVVAVICMAVAAGFIIKETNSKEKVIRNLISEDSSGRYEKTLFESVRKTQDIVYSENKSYKGENIQLKLDVLQPDGDAEKNRAAIIWLHGGGFYSGSKDTSKFELDLATEMVKKGYVCISVDYRLRSENDASADGYSALKDAVYDAKEAFGWVQDNAEIYGIDKEHIAFAGYSAGAATIINLCYSDKDIYSIDKSRVFGAVDMAGGEVYTGNVSVGDPACLIIHGTQDERVTFSQSSSFVAKLNKKDIYNSFYKVEGSGHNLTLAFDDIVNQMTSFFYKQLTGKEIPVGTESKISYEYRKVQSRIASGPVYNAKQLDVKVDGKLDEWSGSDVIMLNRIKDQGQSLPSADDFSGSAMVAWNKDKPSCMYFAATVKDDIFQDINTDDGKWYNDDCLEMIFDFSGNQEASEIIKWVFSANGSGMSKMADKNNSEFVVIKSQNTYIFEIKIDFSKAGLGEDDGNPAAMIKADSMIGFSIAYNDAENQVREHQIGWTEGKSNDRSAFGNIRFVTEK